MYNPRTPEGLQLWEAANYTARVTGRVVFGQLWFRDPSLDDVFAATYSGVVQRVLNSPSSLLEIVNRHAAQSK